MASARSLRQNIAALAEEIDVLNRKQNEFEREIEAQSQRNLQNLKNRYNELLSQNEKITEEAYARKFREFAKDVLQASEEKTNELEKEYDRIVKLQTAKVKQLNDSYDELKEIVEKEKNKSERTEKNNAKIAREYIDNLNMKMAQMQKLPHEFFCKGNFEIIKGSTDRISMAYKNKMYEAACSDSSNLILELDLLKIKVEQAYREWIHAYNDYRRRIYFLKNRIDTVEQTPFSSAVKNEFYMKENQLNVFSSGTYTPIKEKINNAFDFLKRIEDTGVINFLKSDEAISKDFTVFESVKEAEKWTDDLTAILNCAVSERILSDERWLFAKLLMEYLCKLDYRRVKIGFQHDESLLAGSNMKVNPMESYELVMSLQGIDNLNVTFVPYREHGLVVRNECILNYDIKTLPNPNEVERILNTQQQRIKNLCRNIKINVLNSSENEKSNYQYVENKIKKKPDPEEQIRFVEKKYR